MARIIYTAEATAIPGPDQRALVGSGQGGAQTRSSIYVNSL